MARNVCVVVLRPMVVFESGRTMLSMVSAQIRSLFQSGVNVKVTGSGNAARAGSDELNQQACGQRAERGAPRTQRCSTHASVRGPGAAPC